ncbi:hypothetical protein JHK82_015576 [Glycine max]|nr:hypothetical protein JHK82_015576 [Glycine max]
MSTGTGKTIALLSLITSYVLSKPHSPLKLLYCTRTVHEMEKTLVELRSIFSMITSFATSAPLPRSSPSASRPGRIYALTRGFSPLRIVTPWTPMPEADRVVGSGGGHGESQRADLGEACASQRERPCVNLSEMLIAASNNIVSRCVLGRKYDDKMGCARSSSCSFGVLGRKVMRLLSAFCVGDFFPSLCWVDSLTGLIP